MKFRKLLSLWLFVIISNATIAQNSIVSFPKIIPPSPELSSLANVANINASGYTGSSNVQIPLIDINAGSINIPVSINYASNGIKVNDIPSRVGLGWNLIAGGSITRIIHDEDDLNPLTIRLAPPASFNPSPTFNINDPLFTYVFYANRDNYDTEIDEYAYNFNGISGKFYIDDIGNCIQNESKGIKIERFVSSGNDINSFLLTTPDGNKYYFGPEKEKTISAKINSSVTDNKIQTTAWFLDKIISPFGDAVYFAYTEISTKAFMGPVQTAKLVKKLPIYSYTPEPDQHPVNLCGVCGSGDISAVIYNRIDYKTRILTEIKTSNNLSIYFIYGSRNDESNDVALNNVQLVYNDEFSGGNIIKKFQFEYEYFNIQMDDYKRFYLKKLLEINRSNTEEEFASVPVHEFEYYSPAELPSHKSLAQDYFGYFNNCHPIRGFGGDYGPGINIFPKISNFNDYHSADLGANRNPSFQHAVKGSLRKVIFPTKGYKEFIYESNTLTKQVNSSTFSTEIATTTGIEYNSPSVVQKEFTISGTQGTVSLLFGTFLNPNGPLPGQPNYWMPGINDNKVISSVKIISNTTNPIQYFVITHRQLNPGTTYTISLPVNTTYKMILTVNGSTFQANAKLEFNPISQSVLVNTQACGIRVKEINSYDHVSNKSISTFYTYSGIDELASSMILSVQNGSIPSTNNSNYLLTSGQGMLATSNYSPGLSGGSCINSVSHTGGLFYVVEQCTNIITLSSSGISGLSSFQGSPVAYSKIIESDDPNFIHGGIEHTYSIDYQVSNIMPLLNTPSVANLGFKSEINGKEIKTINFKRTPSGFIFLKVNEKFYGPHSGLQKVKKNYVTSNRWARPDHNFTVWLAMGYEGILKGDDIGEYTYQTGWIHLDKEINRTYDENGNNPVEQVVDYGYNNIIHSSPTRIQTTNSKNEQIEIFTEYPTDNNSPVYRDMVDINMVAFPIKQKTFINNLHINTENNIYDRFSLANNAYYFKPSKSTTQKGSMDEYTNTIYSEYDNKGNPILLKKADGINMVYIWDYQNSYPIAEISNAINTEVAYTSFETTSTGGWVIDGSYETDAFTGKQSFSGRISKSVSSHNKYRVTLWSQNFPTMNNVTGTLLRNVRGWNLLEWMIENTSIVTIQGLKIDELRLLPIEASITSFTYSPLIGRTSICDNNNEVIYFQYDASNRLQSEKDINLNIIRKYQYKYNHTVIGVNSTPPNWVPTGIKRCITTFSGNYTGMQEAEERDLNNSSTSYLQTRWVPLGNTGLCNPIPGCTGPNKRVVNGVCETGIKIYVGSEFNPINQNWQCTYRYEWSDHTLSPLYVEISTQPCWQIIID